jgi:hypothetical protein
VLQIDNGAIAPVLLHVPVMYSTSAVNKAIIVCFFKLYATAPPVMVNMYPLIDFQCRLVPPSVSTYLGEWAIVVHGMYKSHEVSLVLM